VVWYISYRHALRLDEAGIKLICDQIEAVAEKLRLLTLAVEFEAKAVAMAAGEASEKQIDQAADKPAKRGRRRR
jgi:hypothetical protein